MSANLIQILHAGLLIAVCLGSVVLSFSTSKSTPPRIRRALSTTPFAYLFFVNDKVINGYQAYTFDVVVLIVIIVYLCVVVRLVRYINCLKNEPAPTWDKV